MSEDIRKRLGENDQSRCGHLALKKSGTKKYKMINSFDKLTQNVFGKFPGRFRPNIDLIFLG